MSIIYFHECMFNCLTNVTSYKVYNMIVSHACMLSLPTSLPKEPIYIFIIRGHPYQAISPPCMFKMH